MLQASPKRAGWARKLSMAALVGLCTSAFGLGLGASAAAAACPNESFRTGASAALPDCRGYELITPPAAAGHLLYTIEPEGPYNLFPTTLITSTGNSAVFVVKGGALPEPPNGNGTQDLYQAVRGASGWTLVRRLSASGEQVAIPIPGGISADHQYTFMTATPGVNEEEYRGTLTEEGLTIFLGNPDGSFELLGVGSIGTDRITQGRFISEGGDHIVFTTGGGWCFGPCSITQLEPTAPPTGTEAIYDRSADGPTRVVSLLPGNVTPAAGDDAEYQGTSTDGSAVAFKIGGTLYLRVDNSETKDVSAGATTYAGLSRTGDYLFYVSGGDVFRFDASSEETTQITATGDSELANISTDGSHVYFISKTALAGTDAAPGEPNLYLWTSATGATEFIATVSPADLEGTPALNQWTTAVTPEKTIGQGPGAISSRATPNGQVFAFESKAKLTAYENEGFTEIYRYDSVTKDLRCLSCDPGSGFANSNARFEALEYFNLSYGGESMVINNLSVDGERVFFETKERLLARDIDGVNDIYEWQAGEGISTLDLISSGHSVFYSNEVPLLFQEPNVLFGISPSGNDVMFRTSDALAGAAGSGGADAIYDARVDGGFPGATVQPCKGQICEGRSSGPPPLANAQSGSFQGRGNVKGSHRCHQHHKKKKSGKVRHCHSHSHSHTKGSTK